MHVPTLTAGTFEPATAVNGKTVASWRASNTVALLRRQHLLRRRHSLRRWNDPLRNVQIAPGALMDRAPVANAPTKNARAANST